MAKDKQSKEVKTTRIPNVEPGHYCDFMTVGATEHEFGIYLGQKNYLRGESQNELDKARGGEAEYFIFYKFIVAPSFVPKMIDLLKRQYDLWKKGKQEGERQ